MTSGWMSRNANKQVTDFTFSAAQGAFPTDTREQVSSPLYDPQLTKEGVMSHVFVTIQTNTALLYRVHNNLGI